MGRNGKLRGIAFFFVRGLAFWSPWSDIRGAGGRNEADAGASENLMTNAQITKKFLDSTDATVREQVLENIAGHYGISKESALLELLDADAEHLLDYVTGPTRIATSILMKRHGLA